MWTLRETKRRPCAEKSGLEGLIPAAREYETSVWPHPQFLSIPSAILTIICEGSDSGAFGAWRLGDGPFRRRRDNAGRSACSRS